MKTSIISFAALVLMASPAVSQTQPDEIRRLLSTPVDIIAAAVFAASTASHRDLCGGPPEFDGHAEMIMRLEFGSLGGEDQERYKAAMTRQYQSNVSIHETLGGDAKKSFCSGLNSAILERSAGFVRTHPHLFEAKAPAPQRTPREFADVAAGTLEGLKPFERLYVVRVAENHMMADARKILADPANKADGYIWAMKVMALEFALLGSVAKLDHPEVASAYEERAEIYSRYVRGEVEGPGVQAQERGNETRKNAIYQRLLDGYNVREAAPSEQRIAQLTSAARELSNLVVRNAKAKSVREQP